MAVAAAAVAAAGGDAAAAAAIARAEGRSWRRGRQPSAGAPADRAGPAVREAARPRLIQLESRGGVSRPGTGGAGGRGRLERQGEKEASAGRRGTPGSNTIWELQRTWRDEICLEGYTNKKNHHPTGFGMTNNRH